MIRLLSLVVVCILSVKQISHAAFNLVGPGFGFTQVNPNNNPGTPPGNTTVATGLVSLNNFYTWNTIGADATALASNSLSSLFTTQGTGISSVTLVSNSAANPLLASPAALPVTGSSNLQRRTTGSSFSADFSGNEAVLFANATNSALIIDFANPVKAAGFRVQTNAFGTNNTFFMQAFNSNGIGYDPASALFNNLSVNTSSYTPFSDTAEFYGISTTGSSSFTRLWVGYNSNVSFAISTLEVTAIPEPGTIFLWGLAGAAVVAWRVRRSKSSCKIA